MINMTCTFGEEKPLCDISKYLWKISFKVELEKTNKQINQPKKVKPNNNKNQTTNKNKNPQSRYICFLKSERKKVWS